ncbi:MAG: hypothetical protein IPJ10_17350 [Flavobacteriales bacterium]|nr:hypothetical protein [Flavobacteriales bacterium]
MTTGLVDAPTHQPVVLWPVPTNDLYTLDLDGTGATRGGRDALGRVVLSISCEAPHRT